LSDNISQKFVIMALKEIKLINGAN